MFDTALQATHTRRERRRRSCGVGPAAGRFLRVKINDRHPPPATDQATGKLHGKRRFARPTLLGEDGDHLGFCHFTPYCVIPYYFYPKYAP